MKAYAILFAILCQCINQISAIKQDVPWVWCYKLEKDDNSKFNDPNSCYKRNNLETYIHNHLLSYINYKYRSNYLGITPKSNRFGEEFDNYDCLDQFKISNPGQNVTSVNKNAWRWEPCHIDAVQYKKFIVKRGSILNFRVSIFIQQDHAHSGNCNSHVRCDAIMIVKNFDANTTEKPKILRLNCAQHERIMSYDEAKAWRKTAKQE